ncbi:MAG: LAGLIDADG family homing endonuclease [bacterium]|nr:LAGLIDADG family homing endonuclease [bacterium]
MEKVTSLVSTRKRIIDRWEIKEVALKFGIELKDADRPLLEAIHEWFGVGKLYLKVDKRPNFSNLCVFRVERHRDIIGVIIPFFKKYSLKTPSKSRDFQRFADIASLVEDKKHLLPTVFEKIKVLARAIHS